MSPKSVAINARKSNDQTGVGDEQKSVARPEEKLMPTRCSVLCAVAFMSLPLSSRASLTGHTVQTPDAGNVQTRDVKNDPHGRAAAQRHDAQGTAVRRPVEKPPARSATIAADGTLTLSASRARLREVLDAISTQARIPIVVADTVANDPVSIGFRAVPLDEGLERLLAAYDVFYLHSASDKSAGSIKAIWVYARGDGWELEPVPPTPGGSTEELETQLQDGDPGERSEAYEALIERQGDRGLATVLDGLADFDEGVRLAALSAAVGAGIEIPALDLEVLVRHDPSRAVRLTALRALEARPEANAVAASVKDDPDELVRNHARQILRGPQTRQNLQDPQAQRQRK